MIKYGQSISVDEAGSGRLNLETPVRQQSASRGGLQIKIKIKTHVFRGTRLVIQASLEFSVGRNFTDS